MKDAAKNKQKLFKIELKKNLQHRSKIKINQQFIFKYSLAAEARDELNKIIEIANKKTINRDDLVYKIGNKKKDCQNFKTIRCFGGKFYSIIVTLNYDLEE